MKKVGRFVAIWVILFSLVLASCAAGGGEGSPDPNAEKTCVEGICTEMTITEPIVLNQPSNITITVSSTVDRPGLTVSLSASPTNVTFGPGTSWPHDAVANQSQVFHSTIKFTSEGGYLVGAAIFQTGGPILVNQDRVVITGTGAVVNPTTNPNPTSDLFIASTPPPRDLTATAEAEPTRPLVEGFTPQEWLQKCGWSVEQPDALTEWPDVAGWLDIPNTTVVGDQVDGTFSIGFKDEANPDTVIQVRIGLCTLGQGWTTDGSHEWNTELRSGTPFEAPVTLRFTETGNVPIFLVVLDT